MDCFVDLVFAAPKGRFTVNPELWKLRAEVAAIRMTTWKVRLETLVLKVRAIPYRVMSNMLDSENQYVKQAAEGWVRFWFLVWLWSFRAKWNVTFRLWYPIKWRMEMLRRHRRGE